MTRRASLLKTVTVTALTALLSLRAFAQPTPTLGGVPPVYLRQGESRDIPLTGQNLATATSVAMPDPKGLTAELMPKKGAAPFLKLTASPDASLGDREIRIVTPTGVTRPLTITVGQLPLIEETKPNNSIDAAQPLALPGS